MKITNILIICMLVLSTLTACSQKEDGAQIEAESDSGAKVVFEAPEPIVIPDAMEPSSESDWEAIVHNKNNEVLGILNILNPVAAYLTAGFEQYGDIANEYTLDDWQDTQAQLGRATTLYGDCQKRMEAGEYNKQLFLDLEETWQLLVKVGVVGVRTKQQLDADLAKLG